MIKKQLCVLLFLSLLAVVGCDVSGDAGSPAASSPSLITSVITNITMTAATSGGTITDDGGKTILEKGLAFHTAPNATIFNARTLVDGDAMQFNSTLTELLPETTYYVRAYAINEVGVAYGNEVSFTTLAAPIVYEIGDIGPGGGFVFEVDASGFHGKEIAPLSTEFQGQWGCPITSISGTSAAVDSGQANTDLILAYHNQINYYENPSQCTDIVIATGDVAAKNCADLVFNGFNDWYLPSIGELELVYDNLISQDLGDIDDTLLSSSTQATTNIRASMILQTDEGLIWPLDKNDLTNHRAVRNF